mgnify:CR=1 FL=1
MASDYGTKKVKLVLYTFVVVSQNPLNYDTNRTQEATFDELKIIYIYFFILNLTQPLDNS